MTVKMTKLNIAGKDGSRNALLW